jgi:hypothetical protein
MNMASAETRAVIERAKRIYDEQLRAVLEPQHRNRFVAIEPESGEYFLGDTFDAAVKSARAKHPSRLSHTIRIGHRAALHLAGYHVTPECGPVSCSALFGAFHPLASEVA